MAANRPKEDVLVHYDEDSGELVIYTVPSSSTAEVRAKGFGGVRPAVDELRALDAAEAMRRIGGAVLGLLDLSSTDKLGIAAHPTIGAKGDEL
ncbi:hypothetical protein [Ramlibacter sp. AN1133]|uniref:hypothetical protein n=1 Tax=Ramlibacter sp. AN1133 TaxID=3133429 RepID=UPI0030BA6638